MGKNVATRGWNNRKASGRAFSGACTHPLWISVNEQLQNARDHFNLIFPVYLKLMTGFPSFLTEDVMAGFLL
jgi:hypothetical protein